MERWQQIEEIFQEALQRDPVERDAFVREACRGDTELQREVDDGQPGGESEKGPSARMPA
jgi:hypothetical protein